ncbi:MAG: GNAT family N-acetyltransferase [Alphaproteobacteria bacterium]|nr:GNAT family N-acetyltransferase [Alphaproteobacteria bacterium]
MALVRRFPTATETEAIIDFFKENWGAQHLMARRPEFLAWQFSNDRNPLSDTGGISALTVWDGARLVGMQGLIYTDFSVRGENMPGVWLCNLMAAPDYKSKGVGVLLMDGVHRIGAKVIATSGINPELYPFYKKLRYICCDALPRYIRIPDAGRFRTLTGLAADVLPAPGIVAPQHVTQEERFGPDWDAFFNRHVAGDAYIGVKRDAEYMNWRYAEHPDFNYRILACRDGKTLRGALVYRMERVRDKEDCVMRIVEFYAASEKEALQLARAADRVACDESACFIDFYALNFSHVSALAQAGWYTDAKTTPDIFAGTPSLFQPLDLQPRDVRSALRILDPAYTQETSLQDNLCITRADGDQDRPN